MSTHEQAVREAAVTLHDAIIDARKAGLAVFWPATVEGLPGIAISETKTSAVAEVNVSGDTARSPKAKRPASRKKTKPAPAAPLPAEQAAVEA